MSLRLGRMFLPENARDVGVFHSLAVSDVFCRQVIEIGGDDAVLVLADTAPEDESHFATRGLESYESVTDDEGDWGPDADASASAIEFEKTAI